MNDSSELRAAIRATSAFRDLSEAKVSFLIRAGELQTFDPKAILMVQGEPSDSVVVILTGEVVVTADSARGVIQFRRWRLRVSSAKPGRSRDCHVRRQCAPTQP
jgi:CRP-like cAMP-binding protein